jgi:hypothetical protein
MRVKWSTILGKEYEGEVIKIDKEGDGFIVDIKLDNGKIKSVEGDALSLVGE